MSMLKTTPAVFAVGKDYQIMVPVTGCSLFWVEVGGECYYDERNGIMRSLCTTHRVTVPMAALDAAGEYTVCEREIIDRKPYFPETADTVKTTFTFRPLPADNIRAYHVADTHNKVADPCKAAAYFGDIDLLIMNGDIPDHSGEIANFDTIYRLAEGMTGGHIPIVFARGNHDLRGYHAEEIADHTPNLNGYTYFTFRLGNLWGIVLDCGEDKDDSHAEYGLTVSCKAFRRRQTAFIEDVIRHAATEYAAEGIAHKLVVCHNPFTYQQAAPFNIEPEVFAEWARLLKEHVQPDLMICGHLHELSVFPVGCDHDHLGQPCTIVVGSDNKADFHAGCGFTFRADGTTEATFYNSLGHVTPAAL